MNKLVISILFSLFLTANLSAQNAISIIGKWENGEKKDLFIEIYKANDGYFYGKNKKGKIILHQLAFDAKSNSYIGKMMPPDKDISINVNLYPQSTTRIKLVGKKLLFTKTFYLTKKN